MLFHLKNTYVKRIRKNPGYIHQSLKYHIFTHLSIQNSHIHSYQHISEKDPDQHSECKKRTETECPPFPVFRNQTQKRSAGQPRQRTRQHREKRSRKPGQSTCGGNKLHIPPPESFPPENLFPATAQSAISPPPQAWRPATAKAQPHGSQDSRLTETARQMPHRRSCRSK